MEPLLPIALFILSMAALVKAADIFIGSSEQIGRHLGIPSFVLGVTVVSFGTSLPEISSAIYASISGNSQVVFGSAVGSNLTNILLILGLAAIVAKNLSVKYDLLHVDLPIFIGATFLVVLSAQDGSISKYESLLMIFGLVVYILYAIHVRSSSTSAHQRLEIEAKHRSRKEQLGAMTFVKIALGIVLLVLASKYVVDSIVDISTMLGVPSDMIAITAFSLGTSLPELMIILTSLKKGLREVVVGNIMGSSIFNLFGAIGIPALLGDVTVSHETYYLIAPILVATGLLYFFITQERQITQWEGLLLLIFYLFFLGQVITSAVVI